MKNKKIFYTTAIVSSVYFIHTQYRIIQDKKKALKAFEDKKYEEALEIFLQLKTNKLAFRFILNLDCDYYIGMCYLNLKNYKDALLYSQNYIKIRKECYKNLQMYKQALTDTFFIYLKEENENLKNEINELLTYSVEDQLKNVEIERVSNILIDQVLESFPLLFTDYKFDNKQAENVHQLADKSNTYSNLKIVKNTLVTPKVFYKIQKYIKNKKYEELKDYTRLKKDVLSIFINILFLFIENKFDEIRTLNLKELINVANNDIAQYNYELKMQVYCNLLIDYVNKKERNYKYEDISTNFYKYKITGKNSYLEYITKKGIFSFLYYHLLNENYYLVEEAYKLFPNDAKILAFAFEIYIFLEDFPKADNILENLKKYCKNDPRTFICDYYKEKINKNNENIDLLIMALNRDPLYYKTLFLIGQYFIDKDDNKSIYFLNESARYCNNREDLKKTIELLLIQEIKIKYKEDLNAAK